MSSFYRRKRFLTRFDFWRLEDIDCVGAWNDSTIIQFNGARIRYSSMLFNKLPIFQTFHIEGSHEMKQVGILFRLFFQIIMITASTSKPTTAKIPDTPRTIDPETLFTLLERIGKGSFGEVWKGYASVDEMIKDSENDKTNCRHQDYRPRGRRGRNR